MIQYRYIFSDCYFSHRGALTLFHLIFLHKSVWDGWPQPVHIQMTACILEKKQNIRKYQIFFKAQSHEVFKFSGQTLSDCSKKTILTLWSWFFQLNSDESLVFSHVFSVIWCLSNNFTFRRIAIYILMSQYFNGFTSKSNGWPLNKQVWCDCKNQSSILLLCYVWINYTRLWYGKQHWKRAVFHFVSSKV